MSGRQWNISPLYLEHGFCANDGSITVMEGAGDDATPVATVLATVPVKRGQGHKLKDDPLRDDRARLIATSPDLLSIAKRWAALDAGGWHPDRCAADKAQLIIDTLAAIAKAEGINLKDPT